MQKLLTQMHCLRNSMRQARSPWRTAVSLVLCSKVPCWSDWYALEATRFGSNHALACDLIIASTQAKFGQVFIKIGLMPDGGSTYFLPRTVCYAKAFELMATGDIISAQEALSLGLVNRVVPYEQLDSMVDGLATRLAASPAITLAKTKQGLNRGSNSDLASALDFEAVNQGACFVRKISWKA